MRRDDATTENQLNAVCQWDSNSFRKLNSAINNELLARQEKSR